MSKAAKKTNPSEEIEKFISFKEVILKMKDFCQVLFQQKWLILIVSFVSGVLFYLQSNPSKTPSSLYEAKLTFILTNNY